jgi:hypothetical protein
VKAGGLNLHPGPNNEYAVLRFTTPFNGVYHVTGSFYGQDPTGYTTTDAHLLHNGVVVFDGMVTGYMTGNCPQFDLTVSLDTGDTFDFAVGYGNNGSCLFDSTGLSVFLAVPSSPPTTAGDAPRLMGYPCQTAILGRPFAAPAPVLLAATAPLSWSLKVSDFFTSKPSGLTVAPETGQLNWAAPTEGTYVLSICASNQYGRDSFEWILNVVRSDVTNAVMFSTRYMDFIVPEPIAAWMELWHAQTYLDTSLQYMLDLLGHSFLWSIAPKQVILFDPNAGGSAHSGNPVAAGPGFWTTDPVGGWTLGAWSHEVAHNFLQGQWAVNFLLSSNWAGDIFHGFAEFVTVPLGRRILEHPSRFGLSGQALENVQALFAWGDSELDRRYQPYVKWLAGGGRAQGYTDDPSIVWAKISRVIADEYGPSAIEKSLRALRDDGLPSSAYITADTALKKNTLLFCVMSCAAGTNLLARFDAWGFDADQAYFNTITPLVNRTLQTLPDEDRRGWKLCPVNGHYYCLTPGMTGWPEAERIAQQMGGHLATIRSAAEEDWLFSRFPHWGALWIGVNDLAHESVWTWTSGESVDYAHWGDGEPNGGRTQNYGAIDLRDTAAVKQWGSIFPTFTWGIIEAAQPAPDLSLAPQLRLSRIDHSLTGDSATITWNSFAGQHYTLQGATNLCSGFQDLQTGIRATAPYNTITNRCDPSARFWRMVVE